jgi:hypothetical protein
MFPSGSQAVGGPQSLWAPLPTASGDRTRGTQSMITVVLGSPLSLVCGMFRSSAGVPLQHLLQRRRLLGLYHWSGLLHQCEFLAERPEVCSIC